MDAYLAVASKRDQRRYADRPVPEDVERRILDAGRVAGSSKNRQPWRFFVLEDRGLVDQVAQTVYAPSNLLGAPLVIAIVLSGKGPVAFDAGRAAQNMMVTGWNDGVTSCPNGIADAERLAELLGLEPDEHVGIVLSFGYPARPRSPEAHPPEEWIRRANRRALEEVARRL